MFSSRNVDLFSLVPNEVLLPILRYGDRKTVLNCRLLSSRFKILSDSILKIQLFEKAIDVDFFKNYYEKRHLAKGKYKIFLSCPEFEKTIIECAAETAIKFRDLFKSDADESDGVDTCLLIKCGRQFLGEKTVYLAEWPLKAPIQKIFSESNLEIWGSYHDSESKHQEQIKTIKKLNKTMHQCLDAFYLSFKIRMFNHLQLFLIDKTKKIYASLNELFKKYHRERKNIDSSNWDHFSNTYKFMCDLNNVLNTYTNRVILIIQERVEFGLTKLNGEVQGKFESTNLNRRYKNLDEFIIYTDRAFNKIRSQFEKFHNELNYLFNQIMKNGNG